MMKRQIRNAISVLLKLLVKAAFVVLKHTAVIVAAAIVMVILPAFAALKYFDHHLYSTSATVTQGVDLERTEKLIRTLELYPYEGWHIQANFHHKGPIPWEVKPDRNYDIKTGPMGFFIDFPPESPPRKKPDEFRIVLIGGSGAQGWGATTNRLMLYKQLEKSLNRSLSDAGVKVRVVNLAMAAALTYQNFIALNRWGHSLDPDLILSYSGYNDFIMPITNEPLTDGHYYFSEINALNMATRAGEFPDGMKWLRDLFPNIMTKTNAGIAVKIAFDRDYFRKRAAESYRESRGLSYSSKKECFDKVATPLYIHALKSIKRDFPGIPIMVAWQVLNPVQIKIHEEYLGQGFYDRMFNRARHGLDGYVNDKWYFVNTHEMVFGRTDAQFMSHLDDEGQRVVAEIIAGRLEPIVRTLVKERRSN